MKVKRQRIRSNEKKKPRVTIKDVDPTSDSDLNQENVLREIAESVSNSEENKRSQLKRRGKSSANITKVGTSLNINTKKMRRKMTFNERLMNKDSRLNTDEDRESFQD